MGAGIAGPEGVGEVGYDILLRDHIFVALEEDVPNMLRNYASDQNMIAVS